MEEGLIYLQNGYSKDNEEVKVFFLKTQSVSAHNYLLGFPEWQEHPTEPNTWIVDEETAKVLEEDNQEDGWTPPLCAPSVHLSDKAFTGCPVGPKGHQGKVGLFEEVEKDFLFEEELVIKGVLDQLENTQLNIGSESARIFLAREIAKDLRKAKMLKDEYTQF